MKKFAKQLLQVLAVLLVLPVAIVDRLLKDIDGDAIFIACSQLLSLVPGKLGSYLRIAFYRLAMTSCHPDCFIGFGTLFSQRDTQIGQGVYIGPQCNIGACRIGRDTLVASGVHIMSGNGQHRFDDPQLPIRDQGGVYQSITIGEDCWIGNGSMVMQPIGDKTIVGAGSVVTETLPPAVIAVGNPARVIRTRNPNSAEPPDAGTDTSCHFVD